MAAVMTRRARLFLLALVAAFFLPSSARIGQMPIPRQTLLVSAQPVPLSRDHPSLRQTGKLLYLGGWVLHARHPDFGGWSGMIARPEGLRLVSDAGGLLDLPWPGASVLPATLQELPRGCGSHWNKENQDAESLTAAPDGRWWVSLEVLNRICRIMPDGKVRMTAPPLMMGWINSLGSEAMLRLRDGRFLVFAEADPQRRVDSSPLLLFSGDPTEASTTATALRFAPPRGYRPTDAAQLPDGHILVLLRHFALPVRWRTRIVRIDPAQLRPGAPISGQEIARLAPPMITDDFEAMAVTQEKRRTIIWLASDDNFWPLQQSYLLKFALKD
jgi:hypothetical protein